MNLTILTSFRHESNHLLLESMNNSDILKTMLINFPNVGEFYQNIPNPFSSVSYIDIFLRHLKKSYTTRISESDMMDDSLDIFLDNNPTLSSTNERYPNKNNILLLYLHYSSLLISANYTQSISFSVQNDRIVQLIEESSDQNLMDLVRDLNSYCLNVGMNLVNVGMNEYDEIQDVKDIPQDETGQDSDNKKDIPHDETGQDSDNNPKEALTLLNPRIILIHPHPIYHLLYKYGNHLDIESIRITSSNMQNLYSTQIYGINIDKWLNLFRLIDDVFGDRWRRYWSLLEMSSDRNVLEIIDSFVLCPASEEQWEEYITTRRSIIMPLKTDSRLLLNRDKLQDNLNEYENITQNDGLDKEYYSVNHSDSILYPASVYSYLTIKDEFLLKDQYGPFIRCSAVLRNTYLVSLFRLL